MTYDSAKDTLDHIRKVQYLIRDFIDGILERAIIHDASKLESPEKEMYDKYTPVLRSLTYGSDEYKENLERMGVALKHHYLHNPHHPEFHSEGINGMSLFDLIEMLADWKAATLRHDDGDIQKSLEINQDRFGITPQLYEILVNTIQDLGWD